MLVPLGPARPQLFLGHYTADDLSRALEQRGFWDALAARGYPRARVTLVPVEGDAPRLRVHEEDTELGEVRAHRELRDGRLVLAIDWIEMRHPKGAFAPLRPQLPGQRAPGLGLGRVVLDLLVLAAKRIEAHAIVVTPEHYHNAALYARGGFRYADPAIEARFHALRRALAHVPLAEASWMVERGEVEDPATGKPVDWASYAKEQRLTLS